MNYQGKRKKQIKFSNVMAFVGIVGLIVTTLLLKILLFGTTDSQPGPAQEHWFPTKDSLIKNNNINYGPIYKDEDVMWIGGNKDTIWE
tara:strand:- start:2049 stop:2312 length:264 start_codon:yes stop_codon:yes gene_type:complete